MVGIVVALLLSITSLVWAHGPQSVRRASIDFTGNLAVDIVEAGQPTMAYQLTADAIAVYQCLDEHDACPADVNKQDLAMPVVGLATLKAVTTAGTLQGLVSARVAAFPPSSTLICAPGDEADSRTATLMAIHYRNILLQNVTLQTAGPAKPSTVSAIFHACP